eukprot:m.53523 g.53523  ORF g.53523 m.53523 type:complete len:96 (-) comp7669_c0_seq1:74-361(-)
MNSAIYFRIVEQNKMKSVNGIISKSPLNQIIHSTNGLGSSVVGKLGNCNRSQENQNKRTTTMHTSNSYNHHNDFEKNNPPPLQKKEHQSTTPVWR